MNAISSYLLRLICAAFLCALILAIGGEGAGKGTRRLICGSFLVLTALSPFGALELSEFDLAHYQKDAEAAVSDGVSQAEEAQKEIISAACETYILNKAAGLGLAIDARVRLDDEGLPVSVTLTGSASPAERESLSGCIARDLGVGKEAQTWIDPYQSSE